MSWFYDTITTKELKQIIKNLRFVQVKDDRKRSEEGVLVEALTFAGAPQFGAIDYKDHRKDSLEEVKKLVVANLREHRLQRLVYYNKDKTPVTTMYLKGYHGGYTGWFKYDNPVLARFNNK